MISTVIAIWKSPVVALFFLAIIPTNVTTTRALRKYIRKNNSIYRATNEDLSSKLTTTLQMLTLTKAHGLIPTEEIAVTEKIEAVKEAGIKVDKIHALFGSISWAASQLLSGVCLFFCVFLAIKGYISAGEVVLFQSLFASISNSLLSLMNVYPSLMAGREAVDSLSEIVCAEDIERDDGKMPVPHVEGAIDFENVSYHYPGEEKQRVSIARALIRNPRILIMDEATSALDNVAEYHVQKAIERLVKERTTFIVAHRLSTIRNADRIVVMEEGKIVELGTYEELMQKNGKFAELERLSRVREQEVNA